MALSIFDRWITSEGGVVVPAPSITVRRQVPGLPLAPIYADREGTTLLSNPFQGTDEGRVTFFAPGGAYQIEAVAEGFAQTLRHVPFGTVGELDEIVTGYIGDIDAGDHAPTLTEISNFEAGSISLATARYIQIGDQVIVYFHITGKADDESEYLECGISLPRASTLASAADLTGTCMMQDAAEFEYAQAGEIYGDPVNHRAHLRVWFDDYQSASNNGFLIRGNFTYVIQ